MIVALLTAATALQGCEPFGKFIQNVGGNDLAGQAQANSGPYTAGSQVIGQMTEPEPVVVPDPPAPPPCEPYKWRYFWYSCDGQIIGSYED